MAVGVEVLLLLGAYGLDTSCHGSDVVWTDVAFISFNKDVQFHRITEWLILEGTSEGHLV